MDSVLELIGQLGKQAGLAFNKTTPSSRNVKMTLDGSPLNFDDKPRSSQTPHRYGVTRPPVKEDKS